MNKKKYHTIVVGGGPAGMMAAIKAAETGKNVLLLEKNEKLGKKLYITGKGRCNLTNATEVEEHLKNQTCNAKFLYSSFYSFDSGMLMYFFEEEGLPLKVERGQRVFPCSDKSSDVIKTLQKTLKRKQVEVMLHTCVTELLVEEQRVYGVKTKEKGIVYGQNVIVATGGISYDMTGSTGDGYRFAKATGHHLIEPIQGLVPIETQEKDIYQLQGIALKNVTLTVKDEQKIYYKQRGEMLFTHFGVSGPLVLSASSYLPRQHKSNPIQLLIDLKPGLSHEALDKRLLHDFEETPKKAIQNVLKKRLPQKMVPILLERSGLDPFKSVDQLTRQERKNLGENMKAFSLHMLKFRGFNEAIITRGGIHVKDINPHTMESKYIQGLYFSGEVLDLDALTGGFNLQIAFSTGALAGMSTLE